MPMPPAVDPAAQALFLDFDGTLVDFVDDPDGVEVDRDLLSVLKRLTLETDGALAIVSGRRVSDLDRFLAPLELPVAGVHGLERRHEPSKAVETLAEGDLLDEPRSRLSQLVEANERLHLEDKGMALVLHYRIAPDLEAVCRKAGREAVEGRDDLAVVEGNRIVEIHPASMDKGKAGAALMEEAPFKGRRPVYVGDDTTDEHALRAVTEMGGVAIRVGEGESVADYRLQDVSAVRRWLSAAAPL